MTDCGDLGSIALHVYDITGNELFRNCMKTYYEGALATIILYDVSDKNSFENVIEWFNDVWTEFKNIEEERIKEAEEDSESDRSTIEI